MSNELFLLLASTSAALGLGAATYHAYAKRTGQSAGPAFATAGSPMSLLGTLLVIITLLFTGFGRGLLALTTVIVLGLIINVLMHNMVGKKVQSIAPLAPVLTLATVWFSGVF
jgi:uncharacterized membrane protein